jgi:hypothetical protein
VSASNWRGTAATTRRTTFTSIGVALAILILAVVLIRVRATGAADQALPVASPLAEEAQPQPEPNGAAPTTEVSPN